MLPEIGKSDGVVSEEIFINAYEATRQTLQKTTFLLLVIENLNDRGETPLPLSRTGRHWTYLKPRNQFFSFSSRCDRSPVDDGEKSILREEVPPDAYYPGDPSLRSIFFLGPPALHRR